MPKPHARGNYYSLISAVGLDDIKAALYGKWATNGMIFQEFISNCLCPNLNAGDVVIMDNVNFHRSLAVKQAIEAVGARLIFLPPYSPDFSPIENMWSKIKSILRRIAPRTDRQFKEAVTEAFKLISKKDILGWFGHCGYNAL